MDIQGEVPNRKRLPDAPPLSELAWGDVVVHQLAGGVPVSVIKNMDYAIVTLSVVMDGGNWQAPLPGIADLTAEMLPKTRLGDGRVVTEVVAYYGATLDCVATFDRLEVVLSTMRSHFEDLLPVVVEMLCQPRFAGRDVETLKGIMRQRLKQEAVDPEKFAEKTMQNRIFGSQHPYGYMLDDKGLGALCLPQLKAHYVENAWRNPHIYMSGYVTDRMVALLEDALKYVTAKASQRICPVDQPAREQCVTLHQACAQAVVHMAHKTITPMHPDYPALYCTNKLLGGFFGSRLMSNLREKKGYTYGIDTYLTPFRHDGLWQLSTAVKKAHVADAQQEIVKEIKRLKTVRVENEELEMLKNYLRGELLSYFDNPFYVANQLKKAHLHQQSLDYYKKDYHTIQNLNPGTIQATAQQYLAPDNLYQIIITQ